MTGKMMTCDSVDELLLEILEGSVSAETSAAVEAHVSECARCTALLRDIEGVREGAAALPDFAPSADLWKEISARIETPVVALGGRGRIRFTSHVWIAAAASLLIVASSGITYWVTTGSVRPAAAARKVAAAPTAPATKVGEPVEAPVVDQPEPAVAASIRAKSGYRMASRTNTSVSAPDAIFASEITRLQRVIAERRNELDPQTLGIVEMNLKLIDAAIKSSRAALAKDPASGFLNEQLSRTLDKKVELLRTVALMPSST